MDQSVTASTLHGSESETALFCIDNMNATAQHIAGMIVYGSEAERFASLITIILVILVTIVGQLSVIFTVILTESLHSTPHFVIIVSYCAADLTLSLSTSAYIYQYVKGCIPLFPCRVLSDFAMVPGMGMGNHIAFLAFERCVYFCYPMRYEAMFTPRRIAFVTLMIYGVSFVYTVVTEMTIGRGYHATSMMCTLPSSSLQTAIQVNTIYFPCLSRTIN